MTKKSEIERLFRSHYSEMFRVATIILRDQEEAHDVVHDIFASIMESDYGDTITQHFLMRSLRNRCLNRLRDRSVAERIKGIYAIETCGNYDPSGILDSNRLDRINAIIQMDLSEASRRVVMMRYGEGMSYKEIADALNISVSGVYKHLRHSLDILRLKLGKNG